MHLALGVAFVVLGAVLRPTRVTGAPKLLDLARWLGGGRPDQPACGPCQSLIGGALFAVGLLLIVVGVLAPTVSG